MSRRRVKSSTAKQVKFMAKTRLDMILDMMRYVDEHDIKHFHEFVKKIRGVGKEQWLLLLYGKDGFVLSQITEHIENNLIVGAKLAGVINEHGAGE